jgi:hypothetical protein
LPAGRPQKEGSFNGEPIRKWDAATMGAMKKYRNKNGISPTGKFDAASLNKLGLGSDRAGKGAPVPRQGNQRGPFQLVQLALAGQRPARIFQERVMNLPEEISLMRRIACRPFKPFN